MLCTLSHQSYKAHQHVPQVAAEHLDLTSLENCVLLLLLLSLWPRNDSDPVIPVFWEKRGSDWTPCLCCAHWAVRSLNSATLAQSPSWFCFLFSYSLLSWWMPCDGVLPSEWQLEWKLCALQKTQCRSCRCVSLCCVTGKWSYQHVKCALPSMRCDSCWRAEWQEWLLKAVDDPCCWGGVWCGSQRAAWGCGAVRSSLACPRAMCHGEPSGWATLGTPGKLGRFSAASQGVEWLQMLPPDWSWEFEGQLNLLMLVLWCRVWEMVMRHEAEQLARLLLEWLRSADSS